LGKGSRRKQNETSRLPHIPVLIKDEGGYQRMKKGRGIDGEPVLKREWLAAMGCVEMGGESFAGTGG